MDELDRMFRRLVQNIRTGYPEYLTRPFEAAELYQTLIPYRHNRRELGIDTNQDYEVILMRLMSGERGYLSGEGAMQETLRRELASPNPDPGTFRRFSNEAVTVSPEAVRRLDAGLAPLADVIAPARVEPVADRVVASPPPAPAPSPTRVSRPPDGADASPYAPSGASAPAATTRPSAPRARTPAPPPPPAPVRPPRRPAPAAVITPDATSMPSQQTRSITVESGAECRYCGGALPDGRRITFCPHCGQNLTVRHCPACSTELEVGWKFCTTCGRGADE